MPLAYCPMWLRCNFANNTQAIIDLASTVPLMGIEFDHTIVEPIDICLIVLYLLRLLQVKRAAIRGTKILATPIG
jgi:hypothetical protein